jgi:hypothetical protein
MAVKKTHGRHADDARLMATVDSESRPYTDRAAKYTTARQYQQQIVQGAARRRPR